MRFGSERNTLIINETHKKKKNVSREFSGTDERPGGTALHTVLTGPTDIAGRLRPAGGRGPRPPTPTIGGGHRKMAGRAPVAGRRVGRRAGGRRAVRTRPRARHRRPRAVIDSTAAVVVVVRCLCAVFYTRVTPWNSSSP